MDAVVLLAKRSMKWSPLPVTRIIPRCNWNSPWTGPAISYNRKAGLTILLHQRRSREPKNQR